MVDLPHLFELAEIGRGQALVDWRGMERFFPAGFPRRPLEVQTARYAAFIRPPLARPSPS